MSDWNDVYHRAAEAMARELAERKEVMVICALVDMEPALRWVEWEQDDGSVAHILISGGKGLSGKWVSGFRVELPGTKLARESGFFL